jgi:hypothetical protein
MTNILLALALALIIIVAVCARILCPPPGKGE